MVTYHGLDSKYSSFLFNGHVSQVSTFLVIWSVQFISTGNEGNSPVLGNPFDVVPQCHRFHNEEFVIFIASWLVPISGNFYIIIPLVSRLLQWDMVVSLFFWTPIHLRLTSLIPVEFWVFSSVWHVILTLREIYRSQMCKEGYCKPLNPYWFQFIRWKTWLRDKDALSIFSKRKISLLPRWNRIFFPYWNNLWKSFTKLFTKVKFGFNM